MEDHVSYAVFALDLVDGGGGDGGGGETTAVATATTTLQVTRPCGHPCAPPALAPAPRPVRQSWTGPVGRPSGLVRPRALHVRRLLSTNRHCGPPNTHSCYDGGPGVSPNRPP